MMIAQAVLVWCLVGACRARPTTSHARGDPPWTRLVSRLPRPFLAATSPLPAWLRGLYVRRLSRDGVEPRADRLRPFLGYPVRSEPLPDYPEVEDGLVEPRAAGTAAAILQYSSDMDMDGGYSYKYETSDGVLREEQSVMGEGGVATVRGSYSYPSPDGTTVHVSYVADHSGFRTIPTNKH